MNLCDARMVERRQRARLAVEHRKPKGIGGKRQWQNLDRDVAVQPRVMRAIDLAHAADAEDTDDLVRSEPRAGRQHRHSGDHV